MGETWFRYHVVSPRLRRFLFLIGLAIFLKIKSQWCYNHNTYQRSSWSLELWDWILGLLRSEPKPGGPKCKLWTLKIPQKLEITMNTPLANKSPLCRRNLSAECKSYINECGSRTTTIFRLDGHNDRGNNLGISCLDFCIVRGHMCYIYLICVLIFRIFFLS